MNGLYYHVMDFFVCSGSYDGQSLGNWQCGLLLYITFLMDRQLKILNWNIRGLNDKAKWLDFFNKIKELCCDIICLQESERENIDSTPLKSFCTRRTNKFEFLPSVGAYGGPLGAWNENRF